MEAAQLIATCYTVDQLSNAPLTVKGGVRSNRTHPHHPAVKCIKSNSWFFDYTLWYGVFLVDEMTRRGVINKAHHLEFFRWASKNKPVYGVANWSNEKNVYKPKGYEHLPVIIAHQKYFIEKKQHLAHWTNADVPGWFTNECL